MKSLRSNLTFSFLTVTIIIVIMLVLSFTVGFFRLSAEWDIGITNDISAMTNYIISEEYPEVIELNELSPANLDEIIYQVYTEYKGKLRAIRLYSTENELLFSENISDKYDHPSNSAFPLEMIRWISESRRFFFHLSSPDKSGLLFNADQKVLGKVVVNSAPFMGSRYTGLFDRILTLSLFAGIILSVLISFGVSFFISKKLSLQIKIFADQLTMMADGNRGINFTGGSTTELQAATAAAQSLQIELKRNEQLQQRKLQDIVHDLKTPVSALGIQFEAIQDGVLSINMERIGILSSEFQRIEEMIAELSKYTRLTSNDYIPAPEVFDANIFINEALQNFEMRANIKRQRLYFNSPKTPNLIKIDRLGFIRVFNNLIINAINNAPDETEIKISVSQRKNIITSEDLLTIEIENDGHIADEDLPYIFDRLYRSKKSGYQGNGLGLAISKAIIEKNNGKITVMNTAFTTVIFRIEIPVTA